MTDLAHMKLCMDVGFALGSGRIDEANQIVRSSVKVIRAKRLAASGADGDRAMLSAAGRMLHLVDGSDDAQRMCESIARALPSSPIEAMASTDDENV